MTDKSLKEFYEQKYAHESNMRSIESIKKTNVPTTRFEAVIKFFPKYFNGGDVLEIGAGNGNVAKSLLESCDNISTYVLGDLSLPRVQGVKKNLKDPRLKIIEMNAEKIQETDELYDAVIMIALIEHLIDPLGAMQNIRKLIRSGGVIYIDTPNIAKYTQRLKLLFGRFPATASMNEGLTTFTGEPTDFHDEGHLHYFTYRSLSLMLTERCGFSRVTKIGSMFRTQK